MMGLSSMGNGGGGNSSASSLSASAPPFTVDRLNPKPNSNPLLHYSDPPYGVEPFSHPSKYAHRSAPRPEPGIDSPEMISVPVSDGYRFSASSSVSPSSTQWSAHNSGYGGDVKPYYAPYVPLLGEDRLLLEDQGSRYNVAPASGLSGTSQHDYTQSLFDLEFPRWPDNLGIGPFGDGKRTKRSEVDGKFSSEKQYGGGSSSHGYESQLYGGGHGSESRNNFKENSSVLYKNPNQVSECEVYTGSSSTRYMEDKSCLEQQLGFFHYDSSKSHLTAMTASSSPFPETYPSVISCAMEKNYQNYQNSCSPYEKRVRPVDTPFPGRESGIRSSPTVVIRPPPATNWNWGQGTTSRKPAGSENAAGMHIVDSDYTNTSKSKDSLPTVVIRPPPVTNWNWGQGTTSNKPAGSENAFGMHIVDSDHTNASRSMVSSPTVVIRPPPATIWNREQGTTSRKPAGSENAVGMHIVDSEYTNVSKSKDSSPTVVIRPPPVTNWTWGQGTTSCKPAGSENAAGMHIVDSDYTNVSKSKYSSPTVVIRPPPATIWNWEQGTTSHKPAGSENAVGMHIVDSDNTNASKSKDSGLEPNTKPKDDSFETSLFKFSKQENAPVSATSEKELSSSLHSKDTSYCNFKATSGSQIPDVNVSSGFPVAGDNIKVVDITEESSESIDHHNTAEDSPCWKGAPSSQFSMFDIEAGNPDHVKRNLDEHYGFSHGEHLSLHSTVDSNRVFCEKVECNMGNENDCGSNGAMIGLEKTLDAICSTTEQSLFDGTTDRVWIPPATRNKGVELSGGRNMMTKEPNVLNNFTSVFDMKVSDTKHLFGEGGVGITVNDVSEGASVAVHVAEKVLASSASQDDVIEHTSVPDPRLDVPAFVKAIHSLSELLRFHISSDVCSLGEENTETLKHAVSNLNSCLGKKGVQAQATSKLDPKNPVGETPGIHGGPCSAGIMSGGPQTNCEASNSVTKRDYLHLHEGERNYIFPGKKDEISPTVPPLKDDLHITKDDDMAKTIKNVLEQNFLMNEEDMHSQALLFKSLWLEAEAKLCSITYKARFERMKNKIDEIDLEASKENEDIAEMAKLLCISPDPIIMSELAPKACGGTFPQPTSSNVSTSGMIGHANDIESSVLARFNILRFREDNSKTLDTEEQQQSETVVSQHADSVMDRLSILKSREDNPKFFNTEEQQQSETVDIKDAYSVMARFNILKSREDNPKPSSAEEQQQSEMVDSKHTDSVMARFNILKSREENSPQVINDEFAGEKYFRPRDRVQSEDVALDMALHSDFQYPTGCLTGGKFDSYFEHTGYESPIEYTIPVLNDPSAQLLKSSIRTINENNLGRRDSSSSEWEHVLKEDFTWKN